MENIQQNFFREIDLFDFTSFFGLDYKIHLIHMGHSIVYFLTAILTGVPPKSILHSGPEN